MSVSYYSFLVYGIPVSRDVLTINNRERGCHHPEVEGANFCPQCGEEMWEENDSFDHDLNCTDDNDIGVFCSDYEADEFILGILITKTGGYDDPAIVMCRDITSGEKQRLEETCKKLGLEMSQLLLGTYLISHTSY